nr:hypothetical protein [Actinomycetota bacterium]
AANRGRIAAGALLLSAVLAGLVVVSVPHAHTPVARAALPDVVAPARVGDVQLVAEPAAQRAYRRSALVQDGRVFSLHQGNVVQGSLQVAGFPTGIDTRSARVRQQLLFGLGAGLFTPARLGDERIYRLDRTEQVLLLSFAPDGRSYDLMVARGRFTQADEVFAAILAFRRGAGTAGPLAPDVPIPDPRRGSPE